MAVGQISYVATSCTGDSGSATAFTPAAGTQYIVLSMLGATGVNNGGAATWAGQATVGSVVVMGGTNTFYGITSKFMVDSSVSIAITSTWLAGTHNPTTYIYITMIQIQ